MAFLGAEAVMNEIETVLQAGMAAAVSAVNSAYTDGVTIATPLTANYRRISTLPTSRSSTPTSTRWSSSARSPRTPTPSSRSATSTG